MVSNLIAVAVLVTPLIQHDPGIITDILAFLKRIDLLAKT
jgi:hypothetical protein